MHTRIRAIGPGPVHVIQLTADAPGFRFEAGQYVNVVHPGGERIPFSIATPPHLLPELELHFQPTPGHPQSRLMEELLTAGHLKFEGPFGETTLDRASHHKFLFVCAGSGFAQAAGMIESALTTAADREIAVLWCSESVRRLYARERFLALGSRVSKHLCIDVSQAADNAGMRWLRSNASRFVGDSDIFLCGGPGFVWAATDRFTAEGVPRSQLHSDVYQYAPRS